MTPPRAPPQALGTRTFLGTQAPLPGRRGSGSGGGGDGGRPLPVFGDTDWLSYGGLEERAGAFGVGLRRLGLTPLPLAQSVAATEGFEQLGPGHGLVVFEEVRAELAAQGGGWLCGA